MSTVSATRPRIDLRRRGDRIEPRLQRIERLDESLRVGPDAGKFLDRGQHVERRGVAVRVLARGKRLGLLPPLAAGDVGEQLEQHVGRGRERHAVGQHVAQGAAADREIRRRAKRGDDGVDQVGIVRRENAEGIADRIIEPGAGDIEFDVPGFLGRAWLVEPRARNEHRARPDCRANGRAGGAAQRAGRLRRWRGRRRRAISAIQRLEHAGGFLAARHAKVQPLLLL